MEWAVFSVYKICIGQPDLIQIFVVYCNCTVCTMIQPFVYPLLSKKYIQGKILREEKDMGKNCGSWKACGCILYASPPLVPIANYNLGQNLRYDSQKCAPLPSPIKCWALFDTEWLFIFIKAQQLIVKASGTKVEGGDATKYPVWIFAKCNVSDRVNAHSWHYTCKCFWKSPKF